MPGYATSANGVDSSSSVSADGESLGSLPTVAAAQLDELKSLVENGKALLLLMADAFETSSSPEDYRRAVRSVNISD